MQPMLVKLTIKLFVYDFWKNDIECLTKLHYEMETTWSISGQVKIMITLESYTRCEEIFEWERLANLANRVIYQ